MKQTIDDLLAQATDVGDVPGVVASVTNCDGTLYEGAFGKRILGKEDPIRAETVVWIASMTKALTGAAAMQLVERGELKLDNPAADWLPYLGTVQVLERFDAEGRPILRAPKTQLTLRQLLTHTAGFGYDVWSSDLARYLDVTGIPRISSGAEDALTTPLLFDPGERWHYGIGIEWVGKIVESVSGNRLGSYLTENLLEPLGMSRTGFKITPEMRTRLSKIHQRDNKGALAPIDFELPQDPEVEMGGSGLYSTASDYLSFLRMILNRGKAGSTRLLKSETVDQMARNNIGSRRVTMMKTAVPDLSNDFEFFPGVPKSWGLTFQINEVPTPTGRPAGGLMWAGLANCYYWIDMQNGIAGVYVTQILPFADRKSLSLYFKFEKAVYDACT